MAKSYFLMRDRDGIRYFSALGFSSILDVARTLDIAVNAPDREPELDNVPTFLRFSDAEFTELTEAEFRERTNDFRAPPVDGLLVALNLKDGYVRVSNQSPERQVCSVSGHIYKITGLYELARRGQPEGELDTDQFLSGLINHCAITFDSVPEPESGSEIETAAPTMTMA